MKVRWLGISYVGRALPLSLTLLAMIAAGAISCEPGAPTQPEDRETKITLSSTALQAGENIPSKYTCDGEDISPPLSWGEPPSGTESFALTMDDPDAPGGTFTHWVVFNLPADTRELEEGMPPEGELENGALQGKNDFGAIGYRGPCPPLGAAHRYVFTLYALDKRLDLAAGASKEQVLDAVKGHILASGLLVGMYGR